MECEQQQAWTLQCKEIGREESMDAVEAGTVLCRWLWDAEQLGDFGVLIVCGAGVSLDATFPGPTGNVLCAEYVNLLRSRPDTIIPDDVEGDLGRMYDHFCYHSSSDTPWFDEDEYRTFRSAIGRPNAHFAFHGYPGTVHQILEREACNSNGSVRVYSLNLDQFLNLAGSASVHGSVPPQSVCNADELAKATRVDSARLQNWRIVAAHGVIGSETSVWSHRVLSGDLSESTDEWERERVILRAAIRCIESVPMEFSRVIFAGVCYPIRYLITPLLAKCKHDFEWMWVNPFDAPQEWLLGRVGESGAFTSSNGCWAKAGVLQVLTNSCFERYRGWMRACCGTNSDSLLARHHSPDYCGRDFFVRSIHRARRIFWFSHRMSRREEVTEDAMENYNRLDTPFDPPIPGRLTGERDDAALGQCLEILYGHGMPIVKQPGDWYPLFTVAVSSDRRASAQVIRLDPNASEEDIADGIIRTLTGVRINHQVSNMTIVNASTSYRLEPIMRQLMKRKDDPDMLRACSTDLIKCCDLQSYLDKGSDCRVGG